MLTYQTDLNDVGIKFFNNNDKPDSKYDGWRKPIGACVLIPKDRPELRDIAKAASEIHRTAFGVPQKAIHHLLQDGDQKLWEGFRDHYFIKCRNVMRILGTATEPDAYDYNNKFNVSIFVHPFWNDRDNTVEFSLITRLLRMDCA